MDSDSRTSTTRLVMSGARGFLGWHTRVAALESGAQTATVAVGDDFDLDGAAQAVSGTERLLHLAGVNRGDDDDIVSGNLLFADQIAAAVRAADDPPKAIVYSGSVQSDSGGVYGDAKARAAAVLGDAASAVGASFTEVRLPNLFGEHGRPFYNAVTSTFSHLLATGGSPVLTNDRELDFMHAQDAADLLLAQNSLSAADVTERLPISELLARLEEISTTYARGEIPDIGSRFARNLFNTYRSYLVPERPSIPLVGHSDERGTFVELVRAQGGGGQSSFSTTVPGVSRGDHFHRRKIERFVVVSGTARISLRRAFHDEIVHIDVTGDSPTAVDMPTMWAHSIRNTGDDVLATSFWIDEIFDPDHPDTIPERV